MLILHVSGVFQMKFLGKSNYGRWELMTPACLMQSCRWFVLVEKEEADGMFVVFHAHTGEGGREY